jgi:hypothetical protein
MRSSRALIMFLMPLLTTGCQENSGGGPGSGPVAFEDYCTAYAKMSCEIARDCDCLEGYTIEMCQTYQQMDCSDSVEAPVNSGRVTFDPISAGNCLHQMWSIARDCSLDDLEELTGCETLLVGTVAENGACDGSEECLPGLSCLGDVCLRLPTEGQACHPDYGCASGNYCGEDDLCHGYQGSGGPCPEGDQACGSGLYCDDRVSQCAPYLGASESCAHASWACGSGLYCSDAAGETCRPYPGNGGDCADSSGSCADGYYCGTDDLCHGELADGSPCTDDEQCRSYDCTGDVCAAETADVCLF